MKKRNFATNETFVSCGFSSFSSLPSSVNLFIPDASFLDLLFKFTIIFYNIKEIKYIKKLLVNFTATYKGT